MDPPASKRTPRAPWHPRQRPPPPPPAGRGGGGGGRACCVRERVCMRMVWRVAEPGEGGRPPWPGPYGRHLLRNVRTHAAAQGSRRCSPRSCPAPATLPFPSQTAPAPAPAAAPRPAQAQEAAAPAAAGAGAAASEQRRQQQPTQHWHREHAGMQHATQCAAYRAGPRPSWVACLAREQQGACRPAPPPAFKGPAEGAAPGRAELPSALAPRVGRGGWGWGDQDAGE